MSYWGGVYGGRSPLLEEKFPVTYQLSEINQLNSYIDALLLDTKDGTDRECKTYINIHKNRPSSRDKEVNIKYMGNWLINQSKNYKKTNEIMKDELIRQKWEEFITDEKYKQYF